MERKSIKEKPIKTSLFIEDIDPLGEPVWLFRCHISKNHQKFLKDNGMEILLDMFLKKHFASEDIGCLAIADETNRNTIYIECDKKEMASLMQFLYTKLDADICYFAKDSQYGICYVVIEFKKGVKQPLKYGSYFYGEGKLLLMEEITETWDEIDFVAI